MSVATLAGIRMDVAMRGVTRSAAAPSRAAGKVTVCFLMPMADYIRMAEEAGAEGLSLSAHIRRSLAEARKARQGNG